MQYEPAFYITNFNCPIACVITSAVVKFYMKRGSYAYIIFYPDKVHAATQLWSNLVKKLKRGTLDMSYTTKKSDGTNRIITNNEKQKNADAEMFLNPEFWRRHALNDLIPYWYEYSIDKEYGGFFTNLSRQWEPLSPFDKYPAMISRQIFGFSTAYLLFGDEKYINAARDGVSFLLEYGWDKEFGGWYDKITRDGKPLEATKSIPLQLYSNVGLTMYYMTTGDSRVLPFVYKSMEIQKTYGCDKKYGGYYQALERDLTVKDPGKNKHAHYGYVGSLLLYLWLATRDPDVLEWQCELTDITLSKMLDPANGWINGYMNEYDRRWQFKPYIYNNKEYIHIGAQLTAALSFIRLYHQSCNSKYLEHGKVLGDKINEFGWDSLHSGWFDMAEKEYPHYPIPGSMVSNWILDYGCFLQLQLYNITKEKEYLERFQKSEAFWYNHIRDEKYGSVFTTVTPDGAPEVDDRKAKPWRTSYHEMEHALLNYLYLNTYVYNQSAELNYIIDNSDQNKKFYVSPIDDPAVKIASVSINDKPWVNFNAAERSIVLPAEKNLRVKVTFAKSGGGGT